MTITEDRRSGDGLLAFNCFRTIPAHVTIKHWQLKNLITLNSTGGALHPSFTDREREEILYVCRHSIRTLNPHTNRIGLLAPKLSFEPRSLCSAHGWTLAGSEQGRLAVMHESRPSEKHEDEIGQSLINGLHIYKSPQGVARALISSNDWTIQIYNLDLQSKESIVRCPTAVNYASVSPDGKMMAAVGDSTEAYIYVLESGTWVRHSSFIVANDACFMTAFNPAGDKLAIASQAGTLPIYDVRMLDNDRSFEPPPRPLCKSGTSTPSGALGGDRAVLHTLRSSRRGSRRFPHVAIRSVQWSPNPLDLLLFTEENARATVVDARDFSRSQDLNVPAMERVPSRLSSVDGNSNSVAASIATFPNGYDIGDRDLSGACFSKSGDRIYIGTREDISEWHVRTYDRRTFSSVRIR